MTATTYRINEDFATERGAQAFSNFIAPFPGQVKAIMQALYEMGGTGADIAEPALIKYLSVPETFARLCTRSKKGVQTVSKFVSFHRASLGKLPQSIIKVNVARAFGDGNFGPRAPRELVDPVTGNKFASPFIKKGRVKKTPVVAKVAA